MTTVRPLLLCLLVSSLACTQSASPAALTPAPIPSAALPPAPAEGGVALEGRVRLEGARPSLAPIPTNDSVARACGTSIPDRSLQLAADGGLIDAVVWVDAPPTPAGRALPTLKVDQAHCDYSPHVLAAFAGQRLALVNSDPLVHSIHGAQNGRPLFNFAQPITGMRAERPLPRTPGVVELRCELHAWMHAYVKVFDHPYFALTDAAGRFRIADVPPGPHTLHVWQPRLGTRSLSVEVAPGMAPLTVSWRPEGAL